MEDDKVKAETIFKTSFILLGVFLISYLIYGFSDDGRLMRDHGFYSSGISDDSVKSIWCGNKGFDQPYKKINGEDYCGENKVRMNCIFSNMGDACSIELIEEVISSETVEETQQ